MRIEAVKQRAVQRLHALVMGAGKTAAKTSAYREGQNVIKENRTKRIVNMPPETKDVPALMGGLISWLNANDELPIPLKAAIAHY
jgi:Fic family protein